MKGVLCAPSLYPGLLHEGSVKHSQSTFSAGCGCLQAPGGTYVAATYVGQALLGSATAPLGAPTPDAFSDGLLLGLDTDLNVRPEAGMCLHAAHHPSTDAGLCAGACSTARQLLLYTRASSALEVFACSQR